MNRRPKWILSLDGGGVRGIISIAFLKRFEKLLGEIAGATSPPRLSDCFDLVGGTSTGAIIASGIALVRSAAGLGPMYRDLAIFWPSNLGQPCYSAIRQTAD